VQVGLGRAHHSSGSKNCEQKRHTGKRLYTDTVFSEPIRARAWGGRGGKREDMGAGGGEG